VEATAELFRSAGVGHAAPIRRFDEGQGQPMTHPMAGPVTGPMSSSANLPVRPDSPVPAGAAPHTVFAPLTGSDEVSDAAVNRHLDVLVDLVVERIEQRVVDELERRGQRHNPGVF
jgi:hypothetical protein